MGMYRVVEGANPQENIKGCVGYLEQAKNAAYGYAMETGKTHSVWSYDQDLNTWFLEEAYRRPEDEIRAEIAVNNPRYSAYEWNRLRYDTDRLWKQGIRSMDSTIIHLQYGYDDHDTAIICAQLAERANKANYELAHYNPDIGF